MKKLRVVLEFARTSHAGVEGLFGVLATVSSMRLQNVLAAVREHGRAVFGIRVDEPDQSFVRQMFQRIATRVQ